MKIPSAILTMLAGIFLTVVSLWYGQNHGLMPVAASDEAELVDGLFDAMMTISVGLFILVEGVLIIAAIRFRRRKGDEEDGPHIEGNIPLEILWTAIPAVIVLGISVYSFDIYTQLGGLDPMGGMAHRHNHPAKTVEVAAAGDQLAMVGIGPLPEQAGQLPPMTVQVKALQYAFLFTYPGTGILAGELHVPANQPVKLDMEAQDVIHAFWVPELRLKQDIIPGQLTELQFIPRREGSYPIICAELCGPYHGGMKTQMLVQSPDDFDAWVQSQVASQDQPDQAVAALTKPAGDRSEPDYLASVVAPADAEIKPETLAQIPQHHHSVSMEVSMESDASL